MSVTEFGHLKELILNLTQDLQAHDPSYIRNKVALLWVEIAKRSWGIDWLDMDGALVTLWGSTHTHREFVLTILEALSEDVFHHEDTISSLRGTDLNRALVEIFTPYSVLKEAYPERDRHAELRSGTEGWLFRICGFLNEYVQNIYSSMEVKVCALKALATLRSVVVWSIPQAVFSCQCVPTVCRVLTSQDDDLLMVSSNSGLWFLALHQY
jgi:exportin-5